MAQRSTTSEFYPSPPGKVLARQGVFRNVARYAVINANSSVANAKRRNLSTAPFGRTGNELDGYTGALSGPGTVPTVIG